MTIFKLAILGAALLIAIAIITAAAGNRKKGPD